MRLAAAVLLLACAPESAPVAATDLDAYVIDAPIGTTARVRCKGRGVKPDSMFEKHDVGGQFVIIQPPCSECRAESPAKIARRTPAPCTLGTAAPARVFE